MSNRPPAVAVRSYAAACRWLRGESMLLRTRLLVLLSSTCTLPAQWSLVAAAPPGTPLALAFDDSRNVAVGAFLVGNALQTWEWNGAAWSQNVAAGSPGSVMGVFVYDPQRRAVLSIDAEGASSNGPDLYEYRGAAWSLLPQAGVRPPAAQIVAGAFDTRRNVLVVQVLDQTWEWDGAQWLLRATTTAPGRVEYARMAYDPLRQRTVMTGGERYDPVTRQTLPTGETWEWDGSSWTL